jgi:two-component system cell cycle response regulator DivK
MQASKDNPWVLLVDDHEDGRELLGEFLSFNGYTVEACASGEEALERVAQLGRPDAVITDLSLGVMSGTELAQKLREQGSTASVPILAVTGHAAFDDPEHLFAAVLVKPVALPKLTEALQQAIGR